MGYYIKNEELLNELIKSRNQNGFTDKFINIVDNLVDNLLMKYVISGRSNKNYVKNYAICYVRNNCINYDFSKQSTAYAYFSELSKRGISIGFSKILDRGKIVEIRRQKINNLLNKCA